MRFFVITGQDYACRDNLGGYDSFESMTRLGGDFLVSTGDNVYYDLDLPFGRTINLARYHWHRIYSQPLVRELFRQMSGYWMKDDHDSFEDDDWPTKLGERVQPMTYRKLAPVFKEQVPMGERTYRRRRWGKGVEMWFLEGRDFRSPNPAPDGPNKTLWGPEQKAWLKRTLLESDARYRVIISPTPIVGPDTKGHQENHADGFRWERNEFLDWVRANKLGNLVIVSGDRHWQYHSFESKIRVHEFSCGALTDGHSFDTEYYPEMHRFLRTAGGFLEVSLEGDEEAPRLSFRFRNTHGKVEYEKVFSQRQTLKQSNGTNRRADKPAWRAIHSPPRHGHAPRTNRWTSPIWALIEEIRHDVTVTSVKRKSRPACR